MTSLAAPQSGLLRQYLVLTKPRVTQLAVFCAVIGMFLAAPGIPDMRRVLFGTIGIWLLAAEDPRHQTIQIGISQLQTSDGDS
ncbi:MAG: hypothetical protein ACTHLV_08940, partial [Achromobacter mucicolens]